MLVKHKGSLLSYKLRCPGCWKKTSLQQDSFIDRAHVPLAKLLGLLYLWASGTGVMQTVNHLGCSSATVVQWYQYFCNICLWKLLNTVQARWTRQDSTFRRVSDGDGKVSPWPPADCATVLGLQCLRPEIVPRAAVTKSPPPVIFCQVGVSHIYVTESQPPVTFMPT